MRILTALGKVDTAVVTRVYPTLKKIINVKITSNESSCLHALLAALEFFIQHGAAVSVDYEVCACFLH